MTTTGRQRKRHKQGQGKDFGWVRFISLPFAKRRAG
jgi:hypothetical protein